MPTRDDNPSRPDPRELIRRASEAAKAERVSEALERMERDDHRDEADSFDDEPSSRFDLSESETLDPDTSEAPSKGTLHEQDFSVDSTVELPEDQLSEPSLSDPSPSGQRGSSNPGTLIATPLFRPSRRPPMAVLRVYDDDQTGYEAIRIRQTPFVVGRQDGDFVVGHERQMSRRHARIDRVQEGDVWRWYLGDLRSTNGTFVRATKAVLEDGVEVMLGGELVRFVESARGGPSLVRVAPTEDEERVALTPGSHLIGTDASVCLPFLLASPFLDPQHFRVELVKGRWQVSDLGSTNHLWTSITRRTELSSGSLFQIGEQRFGFFLP